MGKRQAHTRRKGVPAMKSYDERMEATKLAHYDHVSDVDRIGIIEAFLDGDTLYLYNAEAESPSSYMAWKKLVHEECLVPLQPKGDT